MISPARFGPEDTTRWDKLGNEPHRIRPKRFGKVGFAIKKALELA